MGATVFGQLEPPPLVNKRGMNQWLHIDLSSNKKDSVLKNDLDVPQDIRFSLG